MLGEIVTLKTVPLYSDNRLSATEFDVTLELGGTKLKPNTDTPATL